MIFLRMYRCHENARYSFRTSLERLVQATGSAEWSEDESKEHTQKQQSQKTTL